MFNDGFIDRLAGVMREYAANLEMHPADKLVAIVNGTQSKGNEADLREFITEMCDTFADVPHGDTVDESTILYSSSLVDGKYSLFPQSKRTVDRFVTCKCVHCDYDVFCPAMVATVESAQITVIAFCENCGKRTEVYFVGLFKPSDMPTQDLMPVSAEQPAENGMRQ